MSHKTSFPESAQVWLDLSQKIWLKLSKTSTLTAPHLCTTWDSAWPRSPSHCCWAFAVRGFPLPPSDRSGSASARPWTWTCGGGPPSPVSCDHRFRCFPRSPRLVQTVKLAARRRDSGFPRWWDRLCGCSVDVLRKVHFKSLVINHFLLAH